VKRVLAVLIVVVVLLAVWLSGIGRRSTPNAIGSQSTVAGSRNSRGAVDTPIAAVNGATAERSGLGAPFSATPSTIAVSPDRITIRSSIGLELPFAEVQHDADAWTRVDLERGTCARSTLVGATRVRAPGHVAVVFVADAQEMVLEPDALLTIHADSLRQCVRAIEPWEPYTAPETEQPILRSGLRHAIAFGWLSEDQWAVALSPDRLEEGYGGGCVVVITWRDERTTRATFLGKPGSRETLALVCEDRVQGMPLKVHVVRPAGLAVGRVSIALDRVSSGGAGPLMINCSWGYAYTSADEDFHLRRKLGRGSNDIEFPFAPSNTRLNIAARDEISGAYGRMDFLHDGSPRTLVLLPPFRVTGRLVVTEGAPLPTHTDINTNAFEGSEEVDHWAIGGHGVEVSSSGTFELLGPSNLLQTEGLPLEVPGRLVVYIAAPGFEVWHESFDTHHAASLDCGDIPLVARPAEVVLAPGHGLVTKSVRWERLITLGGSGIMWNISDATLLADGSMAISLVRYENDPKLLEVWPGEALAWPDPPPSHLLIHVLMEDGDQPRAFERGADGRYVAPDVRVRDIEFDFTNPIDHARWTIGWEWRGLSDVYGSIDPMHFGEMIHSRVRAPEQGVNLLWTTDWEHRYDPSVRGGSMAIDAIRAPIVLH
jgi:hypothetical protein